MLNPDQENKPSSPLVSVVLPCLNEDKALGSCIDQIKNALTQANIAFEIVVCDNGSTDNSVRIAHEHGVRVVHEPRRGYGLAYLKGFSTAHGDYLFMGDADATYDFTLIPEMLASLLNGHDLATGSRYSKDNGENIPLIRRALGNPALTALVNALFGSRYTDIYCGLRGFSRRLYLRIAPSATGMEFNLELAIKAHITGSKIKEIPIHLAPRLGRSKLNVIRDGLRSLYIILSLFIHYRVLKRT